MIDLRRLRYFIAIVEAGSLSRAARNLHVAQPALSQHVIAMEDELGVSLLRRTGRGIAPTEAGLRLLDRARLIEAEASSLADHVRGRQSSPSGEVRFGMPGTISEQLGVPLIEAARLRYPNVRIRIAEAMSGYVLEWLREDVVDIAMLYNVADRRGLALHHALTEDIRLFARPGVSNAPRGRSVGLAAALRLKLIVPGAAHGLRNLIDAAAEAAGLSLQPEIEIDSYRQIKQLAAGGVGFGLLPTMAIEQELRDGSFVSWPVVRPPLTRRIYLGHRSTRPLGMAGRVIAGLGWSILHDLVRNGRWSARWNGGESPFQDL